MDDFEDDISELSSIASYPSSPGIFSQNLLELEDAINIPDINPGTKRTIGDSRHSLGSDTIQALQCLRSWQSTEGVGSI